MKPLKDLFEYSVLCVSGGNDKNNPQISLLNKHSKNDKRLAPFKTLVRLVTSTATIFSSIPDTAAIRITRVTFISKLEANYE